MSHSVINLCVVFFVSIKPQTHGFITQIGQTVVVSSSHRYLTACMLFAGKSCGEDAVNYSCL